MARPPRIVVLGMLTKMPVAGVVWQNLHYLLGFERLGYEAWYVELHGRTPSMLMRSPDDDSSARAAAFLSAQLGRYGFGDRWAFCAMHDDGRCLGTSWSELRQVLGSAELIVNLHGGTMPMPDLVAGDRLVYLETDPVQLHLELHQHRRDTVEFLEPHASFFTFAENHTGADCGLPVPRDFSFHTTRQPVVLDLWDAAAREAGDAYTTVGNWRQQWRTVQHEGRSYTWSKHEEFLKHLDLPRRTGREFELALASYTDDDRHLLEDAGWRVSEAAAISDDPDLYRDYIARSRGEFTVAKDQNVRFRTGWFSDRSATYLAAGRPVVTQDTGFGSVLPVGEGLFAFATTDDAAAAIETIEGDHARHASAAREIAREFFDSDRVLRKLLDDAGADLRARTAPRAARRLDPFPPGLVLTPRSRRPIRLDAATEEALLERAVPAFPQQAATPLASVVVATRDNLPFLRLCAESVLAAAGDPCELIVVDNGSSDGTADYLAELAARNSQVRCVSNAENRGFAAACNQGLAAARCDVLVLLNDDTAVTDGWLRGLIAHLDDRGVGMVGPTTNRTGNEAQIAAAYDTWLQLQRFAEERAAAAEPPFEIPTLTMFCVALRRDVLDTVGDLDESFGIGLLEDDDYSLRLRRAGYRLLCAEDVFVHHFGEASFGKLVASGDYGSVLATNQRRFEEKWGAPWQPYGRREEPEYCALRDRLRGAVRDVVPAEATVLVVTRGDDALLNLDRSARHFPQADDGRWAGHHPGDSSQAIEHLETLRAAGARYLVFPETGRWWLDHYADLRRHLDEEYRRTFDQPDTGVIFSLDGAGG